MSNQIPNSVSSNTGASMNSNNAMVDKIADIFAKVIANKSEVCDLK